MQCSMFTNVYVIRTRSSPTAFREAGIWTPAFYYINTDTLNRKYILVQMYAQTGNNQEET